MNGLLFYCWLLIGMMLVWFDSMMLLFVELLCVGMVVNRFV